jgi:hypothetical protein
MRGVFKVGAIAKIPRTKILGLDKNPNQEALAQVSDYSGAIFRMGIHFSELNCNTGGGDPL